MIINNIELNNFGSYEGKTFFDFQSFDDKNIILIGGKNGAGKTTLFTAIRLCIYGFKSFGYQSSNAFYNKAIIKIINNNSKLVEPTNAHVKINISINNGQDLDEYNIKRKWILVKNSVEEQLIIYKNEKLLKEEEIADFEKYIMQIIPPDLFDLYFFDGEKISDFFLEEGSKVRLKNAFLTICGYDIFDIINKNFRRMLSSSSQDNKIVSNYINLKEKIDNSSKEIEELKDKIILNYKNIQEIDSKIKHLDTKYKNNGGVLKAEWDKKFQAIKNEESFRDEKNAWLKKAANETIPFLILKNNLIQLNKLIEKETDLKKYQAFSDILEQEKILEIFKRKIKFYPKIEKIISEIRSEVKEKYLNNNLLLNLSSEQSGIIQYQVEKILKFNQNDIINVISSIKESIKKSQIIREEIEKCNIDKIDDYVNLKSNYLDEKTKLLNLSAKLGNDIQKLESSFAILNNDFYRAKKDYENELKKNSINDISSKAVLMLDKLEADLYEDQISKVRKFFKKEIDNLMRKKNFINDIEIDSDFNISVYRTEVYSIEQLIKIKKEIGLDGISNALGYKSFQTIEKLENLDNIKNKEQLIQLDIELDKTSFSNGEKQIFIMALYKSLMKLRHYEVPFVIDTPFARIDAEHRNNISKYFFRELKGQIFILSTNKEVESNQFNMLKDKLAFTYMLDNQDNKKTIVHKNIYFTEVENVI
ncbi:MAG: AAA family ATPase [Candidatus Gastranaerophilales bacterium]|nr:AAA family ATPase [Candidatus Gastranaerophilales bacterium]